MIPDNLKGFQVRFPPELHAQAKQMALEKGISLNLFVIACVEATVKLIDHHEGFQQEGALVEQPGLSPISTGAKDQVFSHGPSSPPAGVVSAGVGRVAPMKCEHPSGARMGTKCLACGKYPIYS